MCWTHLKVFSRHVWMHMRVVHQIKEILETCTDGDDDDDAPQEQQLSCRSSAVWRCLLLPVSPHRG